MRRFGLLSLSLPSFQRTPHSLPSFLTIPQPHASIPPSTTLSRRLTSVRHSLQAAAPFLANVTTPIPTTTTSPPEVDGFLFQNFLSVEWAIYTLPTSCRSVQPVFFTKLGLPNTTYKRLTEIRDNEAGHLRIFQDWISSISLKPGTGE